MRARTSGCSDTIDISEAVRETSSAAAARVNRHVWLAARLISVHKWQWKLSWQKLHGYYTSMRSQTARPKARIRPSSRISKIWFLWTAEFTKKLWGETRLWPASRLVESAFSHPLSLTPSWDGWLSSLGLYNLDVNSQRGQTQVETCRESQLFLDICWEETKGCAHEFKASILSRGNVRRYIYIYI